MISVLMNTALYYETYLKELISFINPIYIISFVSGFADVDAIYIKA
jgi:hypothetical protein